MKFHFTIIDDTDDSTVENTEPIYDLLYEKGIRITKTVWVYPPRDKASKGDSLQRPEYLRFIRKLKDRGFEIGLHNVGSGAFTREEILQGIEEFKDKLGDYPKIHINHSYNPDNIYGGYKRFNWPFSWLVRKGYPQYSGKFEGEVEGSERFWGDKHKEIIRFSRNHETGCLNTARFDPYMPYVDPMRSKFANYWFSATFAPNQWVFNHVVSKVALRKLESDGGTALLFTHLGYFMKDGVIDEGFVRRIGWLADNVNARCIPVSEVLEGIAERRRKNGDEPFPRLSRLSKFRMELSHLATRIKFRRIVRLDDYAFKELRRDMFVQNEK